MAALPASVLPSSPSGRGRLSAQLNQGAAAAGDGIEPSSLADFRRMDEGAPFPSVGGLKQEHRHGLESDKALGKSGSGMATRSRAVDAAVEPVASGVEADDPVQKVVIVGAGIAGLSAAVALHRLGVKALVLEQSASIRASGSSLTLWRNAWRALDYLGVGDDLRENHPSATGMTLFSRSEKLLKTIELEDCPGGPHEVRGVERKLLIETLAAQLPAGSIQLNSRTREIQRDPQEGLTKVILENGSVITTKVLVGCDGINSVVGKYIGLSPPRYVGQLGIRGVADYPDGHDLGRNFIQYLGDGMRCGVFPFAATKAYWFVVFNSADQGTRASEKSAIKTQVLELLKSWPEKMKEIVNNTPLDTMSRSSLVDRWNVPGISPSVVKDEVTVGGDAFHPMTPTLGQGGCSAIEDGIVLARSLAPALSQQGGGDPGSIHKALEAYAAERQKRTFPITVNSYLYGLVMGVKFGPLAFIRELAMPKMISPDSYLKHTLFDVGGLHNSTPDME